MRRSFFYTFPIDKMGQRIAGQLRIPPDVVRITGITFCVTPGLNWGLVKNLPYPPTEAGVLTCQWQEAGDLFLQVSVPYPTTFNQDNRNFGVPQFAPSYRPQWWYGAGKHQPLSIPVCGDNLILYALYHDVFNRIAGADDHYEVHLEIIAETA